MSSLWKKATSQTVIEDAAREVMIRQNLTAELGRTVRELQQSHIATKEVTGGEELENLCACLEAVFVHGIKNSLAKKMSTVFNSNQVKMPECDFWPIVMVYSHRQVLAQLSRLSQISTDIGRCRSWLRLAMNDGLIKSYMESLVHDKSTLNSFYNSHAYLRDQEQPDIMRKYLAGLEGFTFSLNYNCYVLNTWTPRMLHLAGLWREPEAPEPVMPAVDALSSLVDDVKISTPKNREKRSRSIQTCNVERSEVTLQEELRAADQGSGTASTDDKSVSFSDEIFTLEKSISSEDIAKDGENTPSDAPLEFNTHVYISMDSGTHMSSPHSMPDIEHMYVNTESMDSRGNKLMMQSGWSSSFDSDDNSELMRLNGDVSSNCQSYDSLLQSYTKNLPENQVLAGTPDLIDYMTCIGEVETDSASNEDTRSPTLSPDTSEYEIISKGYSFTSKDVDEATQKLISTFFKIAPEQGLNSQNYKCNRCARPIGMIYGKSHICWYDGYNYCYECHVNEEYYVPARILHNWDFHKLPVSIHGKQFLQQVEEEPLIDIRTHNPQLYSVVDELVEMQSFRRQLSFLRSYLFTCRESVAEQLRKMLWPREYLYEHIHLYSVTDLLQVQSGVLAQLLKRTIAFAKKHVQSCHLCSQKGFVCEICHSPQIIYPFETNVTYHCEDCLAVYHNTCMNDTKPCPKCERRKKRANGTEEFWSHESD